MGSATTTDGVRVVQEDLAMAFFPSIYNSGRIQQRQFEAQTSGLGTRISSSQTGSKCLEILLLTIILIVR